MKKSITAYILFSAIVFLISSGLGFIFSRFYPNLAPQIVKDLMQKFQPIVHQKSSTIFLYIFLNNSIIDFSAIIFFFLFGIVPLYFLASNGFLVGLIISESLQKTSPLKITAALLPHGLLEIPAFIISMSYGLWLSIKFLRFMIYKEPFREPLVKSLRIFFFTVLILNLMAALVEVYVTPLIFLSV